jgi:hypothetical protein
MLIGRRLDIPGNEHDNPMHWWLAATLMLAMGIVAIQDVGKELFGLDTAESLIEIVSVLFVIILIIGAKAFSFFGLGLLANWNVGRLVLMACFALLPLALFLGYAHCTMSHALLVHKLEFKKRVTAWQQKRTDKCVRVDCGQVDMRQVLQERDEMLYRFGYVHLGGWRTGAGDPDCSSVYLFTGGLFTERPSLGLSQSSSRGAF